MSIDSFGAAEEPREEPIPQALTARFYERMSSLLEQSQKIIAGSDRNIIPKGRNIVVHGATTFTRSSGGEMIYDGIRIVTRSQKLHTIPLSPGDYDFSSSIYLARPQSEKDMLAATLRTLGLPITDTLILEVPAYSDSNQAVQDAVEQHLGKNPSDAVFARTTFYFAHDKQNPDTIIVKKTVLHPKDIPDERPHIERGSENSHVAEAELVPRDIELIAGSCQEIEQGFEDNPVQPSQ